MTSIDSLCLCHRSRTDNSIEQSIRASYHFDFKHSTNPALLFVFLLAGYLVFARSMAEARTSLAAFREISHFAVLCYTLTLYSMFYLTFIVFLNVLKVKILIVHKIF